MRADHDTGYRQLFAHPELVRELLALVLPGIWPQRPETCERVSASYTSDSGRQRHDDMVWLVRFRPAAASLYLLLEFQSTPDRWMALRMQVYAGLLCQELLRQSAPLRQGLLPALLPLVLYSGSGRWPGSADLADMLEPAPAGLEQVQPAQRYILVDQGQWAAAAGKEGNVVAALFAVERARMLRPVLACIEAWLDEQGNQSLRRTVSRWVVLQLRRRFPNLKVPIRHTLQEVRIMHDQKFKTFEEMWEYDAIQKGIQLGIQQGIEQGMEQGMEQGRRAGLLDALLDISGCTRETMPLAMRAEVERADAAQLLAWLKRLLGGAAVSSVFDGDAGR